MRKLLKLISAVVFLALVMSFPAAASENSFKCGQARQIIMGGLEIYLFDHDKAAPETFEKIIRTELVGGGYLESDQLCPEGGKFSYSFSPAPKGEFPRNAITAGGKRYIMKSLCSQHGSIEVFFAEVDRKKYSMSENDKKNACVSNLKIITGALELYCMDNKSGLKCVEDLLGNGYLKISPVCYCEGKYEIKKSATAAGVVSYDLKCSVHGNLEDKGE